MYHYETNAIFAMPIPCLDLQSILDANKKNFKFLVSKGYTPTINVMDNQATKAIKSYLTPQQCCLQLVKPSNHCVNASEQAIQTFKIRFTGALGTTNVDFPIQLWNKLAPQVQDSINLLRHSQIDPTKSVHELLEGPYNWNRYPLAPLGTKAVIYEDASTRALWAPHGIDAWLLRPSKDHYRCNLYYVPETKGYRISGSADLFPQHCIVPAFTPVMHVQELSTEFQETLATMRLKKCTFAVLKTLAQHLNAYVSGTMPPQTEQRVKQQRVMDTTPHGLSPGIQRVSDAQGTTMANNPTSTQVLQTKARTHLRKTRANTPGALPKITQETLIEPIPAILSPHPPSAKCTHIMKARDACIMSTKSTKTPWHSNRLTLPHLHNTRLISQKAIAQLLVMEQTNNMTHYTPSKLRDYGLPLQDFEHYAMPMIHPITGKTISSYKRLMNDPATAEVWMTAFGKDFGGMSQGDNKMGQKGTNAMLVVLPSNVPNIPKDRVIMYARVVVYHCPQKADPNRIRITAGENLINYPGKLTTRTANITTAKLLWNSMLSMPGAQYMTLDIKNFYLSAPLDRFEFMHIPFALFPPWIIKQYAPKDKVLNGHIYLEMQRAVWGLPQAGILANKLLKKHLAPHGYFECKQTPGLWKHVTCPISFTLVVDNFGMKYTRQEDINHLIMCIKEKYELTEDWDSNLY